MSGFKNYAFSALCFFTLFLTKKGHQSAYREQYGANCCALDTQKAPFPFDCDNWSRLSLKSDFKPGILTKFTKPLKPPQSGFKSIPRPWLSMCVFLKSKSLAPRDVCAMTVYSVQAVDWHRIGASEYSENSKDLKTLVLENYCFMHREYIILNR